MFALCTQAVQFVNTMYKAFGSQFISDDYFLVFVGSIASIFNAGGRLVWGIFYDKTSFRTCITTMCILLSLLLFTVQISCYYQSKLLYFIWIISIFFTFSGIFVIFPTATAQVFGRLHAGTIYGFLFTAPVRILLLYNLIFYIKLSLMIIIDFSIGKHVFMWCISYSIYFEKFWLVWIICYDFNIFINGISIGVIFSS